LPETNLTSQSIPYILLQGFLFGTTMLASRFSVGQYHPLTYIGIRLTLAAIGQLGVYVLGRRILPKDSELWKRSILLGIFGTAIPMSMMVSSLQYQSSGITAVLITLGPAITVLMAHFALEDENVDRRKTFGILLALSGAVLLVLLGESGLPDVTRANPLGYALVFFAMISGSASTIYARKYMREMDSYDVSSVRMLTAALVVFPLSLLVAGFDLSAVDNRGYFALGYATLTGTFAGSLIGFVVIKRFGATVSAMVAYVIPIVASIGGMLLLDERITLGMLGGMALIMLGLALINRRGPQVVV
jgi:drug/metabolite transporter (DMT)-like permease